MIVTPQDRRAQLPDPDFVHPELVDPEARSAQTFRQSFAGASWADWLFMVGLAGIGIALIAGITMRIATAAGATLLVLMWSAALPPANNPFMDDHIVYALVLVVLALVGAGKTLGLGAGWEKIPLVQRYGILK